MARELSGPERATLSDHAMVRHRDHVHVGGGARSTAATRRRPEHRRRGRRHQPGPLPADRSRARSRRACPARWSVPPPAWSALSLGLTVVAGPLFGYTGRAAQDLLHRDLYISAVLPGRVAMSPRRQRARRPRAAARRAFERLQLAVLGWLTVVWVALWGDLSVVNVVAAGSSSPSSVCLVFPLPPLRMHLHVRPLRLAWLVAALPRRRRRRERPGGLDDAAVPVASRATR